MCKLYPFIQTVCSACILWMQSDTPSTCFLFLFFFGTLRVQCSTQVELIVEFITAPSPRPPSRSTGLSALLQCLQSTRQGGFSVLTLFILALVKMWRFGFLSPGLGGCCGEEIGACGRPPPPFGLTHRKLPHSSFLFPPACHSLHLGPAVTACGRAVVKCSC